MKPGDSGIIAWFDQGQWRPVPAVAESQHMLRASVPHLSIWGVPSLDFRQFILAALSLRASLSCEAPRSTLVDLTLTQDGGLIVPPSEASGETPLIVCPKDRPDGTVDLAVANNRSYALRVQPLNLVVEPRSLLDEGPVEAAVGSLYQAGGITVISPGSTVHLTYRKQDEFPASLDFRPDRGATAYGLAAYVLERMGLKAFIAGLEGANCGLQSGWNSGQEKLAAALGDCLVPVLMAALGWAKAILVSVVTAALVLIAPLLDQLTDRITAGESGTLRLTPKAAPPTPAPSDRSAPAAPPTSPARTSAAPPQNEPQPPTPRPTTTSAAAPPAQVVQYDCPNDNSNIGRYISPGRYWQMPFQTQGRTITSGWVLIGANNDGGDHRARVGIYRGQGLGSPLATAVVSVSGYDGESFGLSSVAVNPGETLYLTVAGIGDFTVYENRSGCVIGRLNGYS
jgi:hypothetical protein